MKNSNKTTNTSSLNPGKDGNNHLVTVEMNSTVFINNFAKFERRGSTYHWKIHYPSREILVGYSKPLGSAEKANKQELLLDIIRRLNHNKYIQEGIRIEFFRNFSDDDADSVKLLTLYGTRFLPEPVIITESWLIKYLKNLYSPIVHNYGTELFPTGDKPAQPKDTVLIHNTTKHARPVDPFDPARKFKNEDALMKYIEKLLNEGHPHGRITAWYTEQIKKFPRNFS